MSIPTETERKEIAEELNKHYGGFEITADHIYNAVILEKYCPDSPGWAGDIALVVHGESCFKDILYKINDKWTWIESMNEGSYDCKKELI